MFLIIISIFSFGFAHLIFTAYEFIVLILCLQTQKTGCLSQGAICEGVTLMELLDLHTSDLLHPVFRLDAERVDMDEWRARFLQRPLLSVL